MSTRTRNGWLPGANLNGISGGIYFQVEMDDLREIEQALGMVKDKSKQVLKTAINNTARQTMNLMVTESARRYQITQRVQVKKTLSLDKKATASSLEAIVTSKGRVNELYNFKVNPRVYVRGGGVPGGYKGKVLRVGSSGKKLELKPGDGDSYKAFVVRYKSGHITVGQRVPGKRMKSDPTKEAVKTLLSPSVPNMLGYEKGVFKVLKPKMYDLLQKNIQTQIIRYLK